MGCVWVPEIRPSSESLRNQEKACVGRAQSEGNCDSCSGAGETEKAAHAVPWGHGEESGFDYGRILIKEVNLNMFKLWLIEEQLFCYVSSPFSHAK